MLEARSGTHAHMVLRISLVFILQQKSPPSCHFLHKGYIDHRRTVTHTLTTFSFPSAFDLLLWRFLTRFYHFNIRPASVKFPRNILFHTEIQTGESCEICCTRWPNTLTIGWDASVSPSTHMKYTPKSKLFYLIWL